MSCLSGSACYCVECPFHSLLVPFTVSLSSLVLALLTDFLWLQHPTWVNSQLLLCAAGSQHAFDLYTNRKSKGGALQRRRVLGH